jgi:hypothetical protein
MHQSCIYKLWCSKNRNSWEEKTFRKKLCKGREPVARSPPSDRSLVSTDLGGPTCRISDVVKCSTIVVDYLSLGRFCQLLWDSVCDIMFSGFGNWISLLRFTMFVSKLFVRKQTTSISGVLNWLMRPAHTLSVCLVADADLFWEKSIVGWLLMADLFWEKSTAGRWLISQTNRATDAIDWNCGALWLLNCSSCPVCRGQSFGCSCCLCHEMCWNRLLHHVDCEQDLFLIIRSHSKLLFFLFELKKMDGSPL